VTGIARGRLPGRRGSKDAGFSFFTEIVLNATKPRHEADQAFGHVRIEVVADDAPLRGWHRRGKQARHECGEVILGSRITDRAPGRADYDIEPRDPGLCVMAFVFEFSPFDVARVHRQSFSGAFRSPDAGHLVNRNGLAALFRHAGGQFAVIRGRWYPRSTVGDKRAIDRNSFRAWLNGIGGLTAEQRGQGYRALALAEAADGANLTSLPPRCPAPS